MPKNGTAQSGTPCRFCGSGRTRPEGVVASYRFMTCEECAFTFTPDADPEAALGRSRNLEQLCQEGLPDAGWSDASFLEPAWPFLPDRKLEILDFGTGQSITPDLLRSQGHRVVAVDVAPPLRPHPDRLTGDILELPLPAGGFDLVFSYQVFEHLPEPRPILARLIELTRPGGILAIHTDMETDERGDVFEQWWYVLPPHHCSFYRHRTFLHALEGMPHRIAHAEPTMVCIEVGRG